MDNAKAKKKMLKAMVKSDQASATAACVGLVPACVAACNN
jgi:hypothetical protein